MCTCKPEGVIIISHLDICLSTSKLLKEIHAMLEILNMPLKANNMETLKKINIGSALAACNSCCNCTIDNIGSQSP
jgi:hypothetical protein